MFNPTMWYGILLCPHHICLLYTVVQNFGVSSLSCSVTWSFRNHSNRLFWCSRNISLLFFQWAI